MNPHSVERKLRENKELEKEKTHFGGFWQQMNKEITLDLDVKHSLILKETGTETDLR